MNVITIPKKFNKSDDLIVLPRSDYEKLLRKQRIIPVVKLTASEKRALRRGREEMKRGDYITLEELEYGLAGSDRKKR